MIQVTSFHIEKQNEIAFSCYQLMMRHAGEIVIALQELQTELLIKKRLESAYDNFCIYMAKAGLFGINKKFCFYSKRKANSYIALAWEQVIKIEANINVLKQTQANYFTKDYSQVFDACKKHLEAIILSTE